MPDQEDSVVAVAAPAAAAAIVSLSAAAPSGTPDGTFTDIVADRAAAAKREDRIASAGLASNGASAAEEGVASDPEAPWWPTYLGEGSFQRQGRSAACMSVRWHSAAAGKQLAAAAR